MPLMRMKNIDVILFVIDLNYIIVMQEYNSDEETPVRLIPQRSVSIVVKDTD